MIVFWWVPQQCWITYKNRGRLDILSAKNILLKNLLELPNIPKCPCFYAFYQLWKSAYPFINCDCFIQVLQKRKFSSKSNFFECKKNYVKKISVFSCFLFSKINFENLFRQVSSSLVNLTSFRKKMKCSLLLFIYIFIYLFVYLMIVKNGLITQLKSILCEFHTFSTLQEEFLQFGSNFDYLI